MERRSFSREFKVEAVRLVRDRGVSVALGRAIWTFTRTCCGSGSGSSRTIRWRRFPVMGR